MPEVRERPLRVSDVSEEILVRFAQPEDWPAVAGLLVELGRGVAAGTADDPTHQMQFAGHLRRIDVVTLVAQDAGAGRSWACSTWSTTSASAITARRRG